MLAKIKRIYRNGHNVAIARFMFAALTALLVITFAIYLQILGKAQIYIVLIYIAINLLINYQISKSNVAIDVMILRRIGFCLLLALIAALVII